MPILQYICEKCGFEFEELVKCHTDDIFCPKCGARAKRVWSGKVFSATGRQKKNCSGHCAGCDGCK